MKILVIEDDAEDWLLLQEGFRALKKAGGIGEPELSRVATLVEAAEWLSATTPDFLIADFYLQDGCSLELLAQVVEAQPHLYVLLISNDEQLVTLPEVGELLRHRRVSFCVKKDLDPHRLDSEMRAAVSVNAGRRPVSQDGAVRILLVDDDPGELETLRWHCEGIEDVEVELAWAGSSSEALRKARNTDYALILVDYVLGGERGTETIARLREAGVRSSIFLVSGIAGFAGSEEEVLRFLGRQQVGFISKNRMNGERLRQALRL